jgi:predicted RNA binding protein YcfA (HicA-like mRNA interferase family)
MLAQRASARTRLVERDGWQLTGQRGSHRQYRHQAKPGKVTVAGKPSTDVPPGTPGNICKQAGLRGQ